MLPVPGLHKQLCGNPSRVNVIIISRQLYISRVKQVHPVRFNQSGARVNSASVLRRVRSQNRLPVFPAKQIAADTVPPISAASMDIQRRILKICMKYSPKLTQAVGVIEPSHRRHNMIFGPERTAPHCPSQPFQFIPYSLKSIFHSCPSILQLPQFCLQQPRVSPPRAPHGILLPVPQKSGRWLYRTLRRLFFQNQPP